MMNRSVQEVLAEAAVVMKTTRFRAGVAVVTIVSLTCWLFVPLRFFYLIGSVPFDLPTLSLMLFFLCGGLFCAALWSATVAFAQAAVNIRERRNRPAALS